MTRTSIREYATALRWRYQTATKAEKGAILDEFCRTTGYHRNAAGRLLRHPPRRSGQPRGRPRQYSSEVGRALWQVWEASGRLCGKRLAPFLPELVCLLERHGELALATAVRTPLLRMSAATIDRRLQERRQHHGRQPATQGRATAALQAQVPIRTWSEWTGVAPGAVQADLVAHCGESTAGFYLTTLVAVDVATGWSEFEAVWGKGQQRVSTGVHHVRCRLPFALRALHTDNGGEFLNQVLYPWCQQEGIHFTRGRPYKKNDQAYAEQKNGAVVRRLIGYDRYRTKAAYRQLQQLYALVRLYVNFLQPVRKLIGKERVGGKVRKHFDRAQTPYQRILTLGVLDETQRQALARQYQTLNPVRLRAQMDAALEALWALAE